VLKLPNVEKATIPKPKIVNYLLDLSSGRNPSVRVVWVIDEGDDTPRLVSAYPA